MLSAATLVAFVSATSADKARGFYRDKLGLALLAEDAYALQFDSGGTTLRVSIAAEVVPAKYTVLGWQVQDIRAEVTALQNAGVVFERFGAVEQDADGIWTAPGGDQVAWFKGPDGNLLSLSHHVALQRPSHSRP